MPQLLDLGRGRSLVRTDLDDAGHIKFLLVVNFFVNFCRGFCKVVRQRARLGDALVQADPVELPAVAMQGQGEQVLDQRWITGFASWRSRSAMRRSNDPI